MKSFFALTFVFMLILSSCQREQKFELKFDPPPGQSYKMILIKKQVITQYFQGIKHITEATGNTSYRFVVKDKQEFTTTFNVFIESIKLKWSSPFGTFKFNSAKPAPPSNFFAFVYRQMIGKKFEMILKNDGKVLTVKGLDTWMESILDSLGVVDQKMRKEFVDSFRQFYSENVLRTSYDQVFRIFPAKKVALNETWELHEKFTEPIDYKKNVTWKLVKYKPEKAIIEGTAKISSPDSTDVPELPELKGKYHVWGIENATFEIDPKTGWILSAKRLSFIKGKTLLESESNKELKLEFPIKIQEQIRFLPGEEVL